MLPPVPDHGQSCDMTNGGLKREVHRVAILGGNRIPFARAGRAFAQANNVDLLSAALDGLIARFGLAGARIGEVVAGAVGKHSRDFNLTRECVLGSRLDPRTPAYDLQRACGTGLESVIAVANKIALGQIEVGIAGGVDSASDPPLAVNDELRRLLISASRARNPRARLRALRGLRPRQLKPELLRTAEPRTGLSMGEHAARTAAIWDIGRSEQDEYALGSHQKLAAAYERGFFDDLMTPYAGLTRDECLRSEVTTDRLAALKPAFGTTMTAGNSTALSDGAALVLLSSEEWAASNNFPVQAYFVAANTTAVDYVHGEEGLLMAPAYGVPALLERNGLTFSDLDLFELHEAFAAQILATLAAWQSRDFCFQRLKTPTAIGTVHPGKLNVVGSSLATGHPFAATGARIVATLAKLLSERGQGRGVVSICAAGGQGVTALFER